MAPKLIILDMDGTLYDLNDVLSASFQMQVQFLSSKLRISEEKAISMLADNNIYPEIRKESKSATEFFIRMGLDLNEWSKYRDTNFNVDAIDIKKSVNDNLLAKFAMISPIILLSSNSYGCIQKVFSRIRCSLKHFTDVICSDHFTENRLFSKKEAMLMVEEKYSIAPKDMLSIGDRYKTDILPMLEIGGNGVLLSSYIRLEQVYNDLNNNNLHSREEYVFYSTRC